MNLKDCVVSSSDLNLVKTFIPLPYYNYETVCLLGSSERPRTLRRMCVSSFISTPIIHFARRPDFALRPSFNLSPFSIPMATYTSSSFFPFRWLLFYLATLLLGVSPFHFYLKGIFTHVLFFVSSTAFVPLFFLIFSHFFLILRN